MYTNNLHKMLHKTVHIMSVKCRHSEKMSCLLKHFNVMNLCKMSTFYP